MDATPPPIPSDEPPEATRPAWLRWLPWGLLAVAIIAGVAVGIDRQNRINSLEDDLAATEVTATVQEGDLSEQASSARKAARGLDRSVRRQRGRIATLNTQLARSRASVARLEQQVADDTSTNADLRAELSRTQSQLAAAASTGRKLATCQSAARQAAVAGQHVSDAVANLEVAATAAETEPVAQTSLANAAAALRRAEAQWERAEPDLVACQ